MGMGQNSTTFHFKGQPQPHGHGSKSVVPPVNIPIPTKTGSKMGGAPNYPKMGSKTVLTTTSQFLCVIRRLKLKPLGPSGIKELRRALGADLLWALLQRVLAGSSLETGKSKRLVDVDWKGSKNSQILAGKWLDFQKLKKHSR